MGFRPWLSLLDDMDDIDLIAKYLLPRHLITTFCNSLSDKLIRETNRSCALGIRNPRFGCIALLYIQLFLYGISGVADGITCGKSYPSSF